MELKEQQVADIRQYLQQYTIPQGADKEELLDHFCCCIETEMNSGTSYVQALQLTKARWNENEVQKFHSSPKHSSFMFKLSLAASVAALLTLSWPSTEMPSSDNSLIPASACMLLEPPSSAPLTGGVTFGYGPRKHPITKKQQLHKGVDFKANLGTAVQATGQGIVVEAGDKGAYGLCVIIQHDEVYQTLYAHLAEIDVIVGDKITLGQEIGKVGSTGMSTGPHLHYEVIKNGVSVNPADYLP